MTFYNFARVRLVLGAAMITGWSAVAGAQSLKCRPADATSAGLVAELKRWATTTDPSRVSQRDTLFHVPVVSVSQITVVTDEKVCLKVIQGYSLNPVPYTPTRLYVIKLGSKGYVGFDPDRKNGEFSVVHIFDSHYRHIGGWGGA